MACFGRNWNNRKPHSKFVVTLFIQFPSFVCFQNENPLLKCTAYPQTKNCICMFFCTVHCNIIIQCEPTKCTFSKLIFYFWCLVHILNLRVHLQKDGCIYRYGIVCFIYWNYNKTKRTPISVSRMYPKWQPWIWTH